MNPHLLLCFARYCWRRRNEYAPNKERIGEVTRQVTWAEVFKLRTGMTLEQYRDKRNEKAS